MGGVCGELPSAVAPCGRVSSCRGTVWALFVGSYKLMWHGVGGVCGELQTDVARRGQCLGGVTS